MCCIGSCVGTMLGNACSTCCGCSGHGKRTSLAARIGSIVLFTIAAIFILVASLWGAKIFKNWPYGEDEVGSCEGTHDVCYQKLLVTRIGIDLAFVFAILFICGLLLCVSPNAGCTDFSNGWWGLKTTVFIVLLVPCYFIPPGVASVFFYILLVGAVIFVGMQILLFIDFSMEWNQKWVNADRRSCLWIFTILCALGWLTFIVLSYVFYGMCTINILITTISLVLSILTIIISFTQENSSIFTTSLILIYCGWLNFSSVMSNPNSDCFLLGNIVPDDSAGSITTKIISIAFLYLALLYSVFTYSSQINDVRSLDPTEAREIKRSANPSSYDADLIDSKPKTYSSDTATPPPSDDAPEEEDEKQNKQTPQGPPYPYWKLFSLMLCAACYMTIVINGWSLKETATDDPYNAHTTKTALWAKTASTWVCMLVYLWILVAPALGPKICPGRTWD